MSAFVRWDGQQVLEADTITNETLLARIEGEMQQHEFVIEMVACYGMPVGREVFETCLWIGQFKHAIKSSNAGTCQLVYRLDVKLHHCNNGRAKDQNVRQALIDKFGQPGTKRQQGVTYGLSKHLWSAFAIATYVTERQKPSKPQ